MLLISLIRYEMVKKNLAEVKNNQQKFKSFLGRIKKGKKSKEQKKYFVQY